MAVFLSYRRDDSTDITARIEDRLSQHFGKQQVFRDLSNVGLGQDFTRALNAALDRSSVLLAIIGPGWARGPEAGPVDYVQFEVARALERGIPVVPVLVLDAKIPTAAELPPELKELPNRQACQVDSGQGFDGDVRALIAGIEDYLQTATTGDEPARPEPPPDSASHRPAGRASTPAARLVSVAAFVLVLGFIAFVALQVISGGSKVGSRFSCTDACFKQADRCDAACPPSSDVHAHIACAHACSDQFQKCKAACP